MPTYQHRISPTPPFDFAKSLSFLDSFPPAYGDQTIRDGAVTKAARIDGHTFALSVASAGTVDAPALAVTLHSDAPLPDNVQARALERIRRWLSTEDDLTPFYAAAQDDPQAAPLVDRLYGYHQVRFFTPFENTIWAMLSARNGRTNATNAKRRLLDRWGGNITLNDTGYAAFPEAHEMLPASHDDLLHIARQDYRARYLGAAIRAFAAVDEDWLFAAPDDEVYRWLRSIEGVGEWTAGFIMLRGLGRMAELRAPDENLIGIVSRRYGAPANAKGTLRAARPYAEAGAAGYWAHYLRVGG
jgi:DNA-3-methyladenine glycosylase II